MTTQPKKKQGRPRKEDGKKPFSTRLDAEIIAIIKAQPHQSDFIKEAVIEKINKK